MRVCRACESARCYEVLDLGRLPLAGDFRPLGEHNELLPLAIDGCEVCGLLQVRETVPPDVLFGPAYAYASSTVPGLVRHFRQYAGEIAATQPSGRTTRLLEIGCNDGVFLRPLQALGIQVVGMEASSNVACHAQALGLDVHVGLFDRTRAADLLSTYGPFDVVSCSNVFAHNPDVNSFLEGVVKVLKPDGRFLVEVHSAEALHRGLQWDFFYHEHCFYWTLQALASCLARHGFGLASHSITPMHGGSHRATFTHLTRGAIELSPGLREEDWELFGAHAVRSRRVIDQVVHSLPISFAYGASGRAVTLINWTGIADRLSFAVDGSPLRVGHAVPNTAIPIIAEEEFFSATDSCEWCFVTAHNWLEDISRKVTERFGDDVNFVTPLPHVQIS